VYGSPRRVIVPPQPSEHRSLPHRGHDRECRRLSQDPDPGALARGQPAAQGARGRRHQARLRRRGHPGQVRPRHADALVSGTTDPQVPAELARRQMRKKIPALREALEGRFDAHHALWIGAILAHVDFLDEQIDRLSDASEEQIRPFAPAVDCCARSPASSTAAPNPSWPRSAPTRRRSRPRGTWPRGPASVPATTSRPASAAPARPAPAPSGWTTRSNRPPSPRCASRPPTPPRNTNPPSPGALTRRRSAPSNTPSSAPSGTE
jgi:hypothetical protein